MAAGALARSVWMVEMGSFLPGAISPPLSFGDDLPIQGRADASFSAFKPAPANRGHDPPRTLLAILPPFGPRLVVRGESGLERYQGCPRGRGADGPRDRGVTTSLFGALYNLTFSCLAALSSWMSWIRDLGGPKGSPFLCEFWRAVIWPIQ